MIFYFFYLQYEHATVGWILAAIEVGVCLFTMVSRQALQLLACSALSVSNLFTFKCDPCRFTNGI